MDAEQLGGTMMEKLAELFEEEDEWRSKSVRQNDVRPSEFQNIRPLDI